MGYRFLVILFICFPLVHSCRTGDAADNTVNGSRSGADLTSILHHQKTAVGLPLYGNNENTREQDMDTGALKKTAWYSNVIASIAASEYDIRYQDQYKRYSSPNRRQNLRADYSNGLFCLSPRNDSADKWKLDLQMLGVFAGNNRIYSPSATPKVEQNTNTIRFNNNNEFTTEYINSEEGVRQNFIITQKPSGDPESIRVKLKANAGWFVDRVNKKELHFAKARRNGYSNKLTYNDLTVWDADHKKLEAEFFVSGNEIAIQVITKDARYPVTIDPISTTPASTVQSNQVNAYMGFSVSSAGDVNGDGYSDVIVGAYLYDNGLTDEGAAFIYHGSPTGISTTAASFLEGNQSNANFGIAVSTAGNVNGDAYSDVIVGASIYDSGQTDEGAAFVFHGSATGIIAAGNPGNANSFIQSNQSNTIMGISVSTAGDVNADGYSDVIVGAYNYDNGNTDEGAAFVYHGSAAGIIAAGNPGNANRILDCNQDFGFMGVSVASAGDVNGDGFSDVVVGAYGYETGILFDNGAAFVYHGSAGGAVAVASATVTGTQDFGLMGNSVSSAGDVNGDGYSDVIVGAYNFDNGQVDEGVAYIYHGSAGGMNTVAAVMLESNQASAYFANSVACAGDVNGDGYSDIIIGCQYYTNGQSGEGAIFVYQGSATGISTTFTTSVESNQASALLGASVASAGDVNGDGFSDVIAGAYNYDSGESDEGTAFVYHGGPEGASLNSSWFSESNQGGSSYAYFVASAGDVNADGYSDVIIGAYQYDNVELNEGRAFVYHGSATGLPITANWTAEPDQANANFGVCVATAGDVNGDGYSDVIVGAYNYSNGEAGEGGAFVYHGSASGLSAAPNWTKEINQVNARFGYYVSSAGDVNADGYSDVIIGAYAYDNGETDEGGAFVYHGSATGLSAAANWTADNNQASSSLGIAVSSAGDVNGDGFCDVVVGAYFFDNPDANEGKAYLYYGSATGLSLTPNWTYESNVTGALFGYPVAAAGDVNGDGYGDLIIGAYQYANGQATEGAVYVFHGSATGPSLAPDWIAEGNVAGAWFGYSVASAGDVNGDGYSDVIIGARAYGNGEAGEGKAYVYHGSSVGLPASPNWSKELNITAVQFGTAVSSAGDINGDGYSDIVVGAHLYTNGQTSEGVAFLYYGNNGASLRSNLRIYNTDLTTPITRSNYNNPNLFGAGHYAKSPIGRMKGRLNWEVKANGQPFSGNPITNSVTYYDRQVSWTNLGTTGLELKNLVQKRGRQTKIRTRVEYDKVTAITGQVYGPWRYPPGYTMGAYGMNSVPLPLMLIAFSGQFADEHNVQLRWITENEINVRSFVVERSSDGISFTDIGQLNAKGINGSRSDYALLDQNVKANLLYYRLRIIEQNGDISYSNIITLSRSRAIMGSIAPNPVGQGSTALLSLNSPKGYVAVQIRIVTAGGQTVRSQNAILQKGKNEISIPMKELARGGYVVNVMGEGIKESYRLIVE